MPPKKQIPKIQRRAAELRHNQTEAEQKLWQILRSHQLAGVHFRRQHPIGNFIVDFCSPREKIVIELDGSQHIDQAEYDQQRTEYLQALGYQVLRFKNADVMKDAQLVAQVILEHLDRQTDVG
jgi:very-short-patch-repair endonuclease